MITQTQMLCRIVSGLCVSHVGKVLTPEIVDKLTKDIADAQEDIIRAHFMEEKLSDLCAGLYKEIGLRDTEALKTTAEVQKTVSIIHDYILKAYETGVYRANSQA